MKGPMKERWMELCEQAVNEQDPERFMKLMREINDLLEAKADRISPGGPATAPKASCPK